MFHKILFHVYHDYLPAKDWTKVRQSVPLFEDKINALQSVKLPGWMADKEEVFQKGCQKLEKAVSNLGKIDKNSKDTVWESAIEKVHDAYVSLAEIME